VINYDKKIEEDDTENRLRSKTELISGRDRGRVNSWQLKSPHSVRSIAFLLRLTFILHFSYFYIKLNGSGAQKDSAF